MKIKSADFPPKQPHRFLTRLRASIIIPTRDRMRDLSGCLRAVRKSASGLRGRAEVIVVDDGSRDGTPAMVRKLARIWGRRLPLRLIHLNKPHGPATARNRGARAARSETLVFTDSDCIPKPGWFGAILSAISRHPEADVVEGRTLPNLRPPHGIHDHSVENRNGKRWLTCNLAVKRSAFLNAGGFDEHYRRPVREDTDFAFAMLECGARTFFSRNAVVVHPVRAGGPGKFLREAKQGIYEPLIFAKYPLLYLTKLKWLDGYAFPAWYLGFYAGAVWAILMWMGTVPAGSRGITGAVILGAGALLASVLARIRGRRWTAGELPALALESLIVPFIRLWWVALGCLWVLGLALVGRLRKSGG